MIPVNESTYRANLPAIWDRSSEEGIKEQNQQGGSRRKESLDCVLNCKLLFFFIICIVACPEFMLNAISLLLFRLKISSRAVLLESFSSFQRITFLLILS